VQGVAGQLFSFWSELGFVFPPFPFIAHSRGWDAEDMDNNVRQVRGSERLKLAAEELAGRALEAYHQLATHPRHDAPMELAGRKAQSLAPRAAQPESTIDHGR